ncbi:O-antigen ligase family protein [Colwellia sp. RSH04]|uniref:O-antigen ligase family protein n=1 Tax=Colwellia sp. RSH04 TaxID=2305464 RepID=UPI000E598DA0|nr:O-antigen ligase family protein [Colwellia sp. RSH04]RHW74905.1 hypothetical protein D1094_16655 [Colwellia sp. RSH04]
MNYSLTDKIFNVLSFYRLILIAFVCCCLFFIAVLVKLSILPSFIDEAILFGLFIYAVYKSQSDEVVKYVFLLYLFLFFLYALLSYQAIASRGIITVLLQIFIHLKYMLFFIFCWGTLGPKNSLTFIKVILTISVVFLLINLLTGGLFNTLFDTKVNLRAGSARPIGIQADTGSLGTTFALIGCLLVSGLKSSSNNIKITILLAMTVLILIASTRTALVLLPLVVLWWLRDSIKSFFIASILLACSVFFIQSSKYMDEMINITIENIEWTLEDPVASSYIRGIMIYFAFDLAADRFPFGTGAGTYGTVMSDNSAVYAEIGLQDSRYFIEKDGIYDSNFASLLGEFGFIGLFLYLFIFYRVINAPFQNSQQWESEGEFRFVLFSLVLAYGVTTPIFMNTYPAFILSLVMVASFHCINNNSASENK